jgi:hypothetical protein
MFGCSCNFSGLMRAIGRLIRARQEERIIQSSVQELKFNILSDVRYEVVRIATDLACQRPASVGKSSLTFECFFFFIVVSFYAS